MYLYDAIEALADALYPSTITRIVKTPECYVVCACSPDGYPFMQPPYSLSLDCEKVGFYSLNSDESKDAFHNGEELYADYSVLKHMPVGRTDGGPGSGNFGHAGVPGKVGGSAPSSLNAAAAVSKKVKSSIKQMTDDDSEGFLEDWLDIHGSERRAIVKSGNIQSEIDKRLAAIDSKRQEFSSSVCDTSAQRKKIDEIAPTLVDEKIEKNYSISETGEILEYVTGSEEGADITNFDVPYATIHNHPGIDVTFSTTDIETFAKNDKMTSMTVQAKGTVYSIEKTDQKAEKNIADMYGDYYGIYSSNRSSEENFYKMRVWLYLNAHKYGVLYSEHENSRNDGGPGSGNHGHKGVPGQVGGSAPSESSGKSAGTSGENLAYKSLVPENSYTKTSAEYKNALDAYRTAIRKGDEAKDKYIAAKNAMKSESKPKPESEWDDNDIFEDLIGHRPMIYTEKGKQLKAEYDKYFKESMDYSHEMTVAGDKLRGIKQKEHDKQSKDIHLEHTKDATSNDYEGFTTKTTGTSYYDDYLNGEKNGGHIAEMSPKEYLQRCAYQIFDSATIESTIAALDDKNVKKYAEQMKSGTKFDMPYLNFASGQQEGRHRAAAAMQLGIDKIPVLVVGERFAKYDGGPGSGNFNHEGRPGEVGGSSPKGSADSTASVQKLSKLKDGFSNLTKKQQFAFLKKTGSISVSDLYTLETKINSGDNSVAEDLKKYSKSYFDNVESSKTVKSLDCDTRNKVSAMSRDDARAWIDKSVHRNFNESEMWWVNWSSNAQKVAIDLGMNETPQVVSKEDFNKYVEESGAAVCYRGVRYAGSMSGSNMIYQMAYDKQKNYFGNGIYGDGLYFSTDRSVADSYSDGSGAVAKCAIRPDAKVVEFKSADIENARRKYGTSDYAIAAMCSGYDAIKVHVSGSEDYYVVLNRAAMVMEDPVDSLANMAIAASERNAAKKSSS